MRITNVYMSLPSFLSPAGNHLAFPRAFPPPLAVEGPTAVRSSVTCRQEARAAGRPGCYFLSNFASVPSEAIKYSASGSGSREFLALEYHSPHVSAIDIQVGAGYNAGLEGWVSRETISIYPWLKERLRLSTLASLALCACANSLGIRFVDYSEWLKVVCYIDIFLKKFNVKIQ